MSTTFKLLPVLFLAEVNGTEQWDASRHDDLFRAVASSLEARDLRAAHASSQELLAEFPRSVSALSVASAVASQRGQHATAHAYLDATLRVLPPDDAQEPQTVLQLATELVTLRRTSTARLILHQLLSRAGTLTPAVAQGVRQQLARVERSVAQQDTLAVALTATGAQATGARSSSAFVTLPSDAVIAPPPRGRPRLVIFVHTCEAYERSRAEVASLSIGLCVWRWMVLLFGRSLFAALIAACGRRSWMVLARLLMV